MKTILFAWMLLVLCVPSHARPPTFYGGAQWGAFSFEAEQDSIEVSDNFQAQDVNVEAEGGIIEMSPKTIGISFGLSFFDWLAAEWRIGTGIQGEDNQVTIMDEVIETEFNLEYYFSGYLQPEFKTKYFKIYGLIGHTSIKASASIPQRHLNIEEVGLSYGAGIGLGHKNKMMATLEYMQLIDSGAVSMDGINFTVQFPLF